MQTSCDDQCKKNTPTERITDIAEKKSVDKYDLEDNESQSMIDEDAQPSWSEMSLKMRALRTFLLISKLTCAVVLLYLFVCSLELISIGFRIVGGSHPQRLLSGITILSNSVVGLMCGILITIVVQSSSTTTSAVVGLVAGKIIPIKVAIPIIMGANIGTSVTNTLLAITQVADRDKFRRAFAAATVHDMFNWLTTLFILQQVDVSDNSNRTARIMLLKFLTEPVTKNIIKLDTEVIRHWNFPEGIEKYEYNTSLANEGHLFAATTLSDNAVGAIVIVFSFVSLLTCLFLMVKLLKSLLKGKLAVWIRRTSKANLPHCPKMTNYLLMLMGAALTFIVQSSSAFTSTLPPLVSVKAITLERAYVLTLGANIGTTTTALLAALAQTDGKSFAAGLQIALCHLLFNLTGVLLFYPIPCTRWPIQMSKSLGNTTARYRWFAIFYVVILFIFLPLLFMGLAFAGPPYVLAVAFILVMGFLFVVSINSLRKYPRFLPKYFHTWKWLPECLRSLEPYDRLFKKCTCCRRLVKLGGAHDNSALQENKDREELAEFTVSKPIISQIN